MILSTNPITRLLFSTAVPLAEIAVNLAFLTVTTRVLFAQAFDRLLPVRVAKVGERNHAPNVAIAIVLVIGAAFCYLTSSSTSATSSRCRACSSRLSCSPAGWPRPSCRRAGLT